MANGILKDGTKAEIGMKVLSTASKELYYVTCRGEGYGIIKEVIRDNKFGDIAIQWYNNNDVLTDDTNWIVDSNHFILLDEYYLSNLHKGKSKGGQYIDEW